MSARQPLPASVRAARALSFSGEPPLDSTMAYEHDTRTRLDLTIDKIGMGYYQWALLALCGLGWMADNMWLQAIAIALPRVQDHFDVPDHSIGWLSTLMFAGMMFGAVGWGTCSDMIGRTPAFNATLSLTTIFGLLATLAPTFPLLCISLFFLGTAVGGSMPTDGTLFLENVPRNKRYLLTILSVFFSLGAVASSVFAIIVIPPNSCPSRPRTGDTVPCDVSKQNMGWKYLFLILTTVTGVMFVARIFLFRLFESPRYLVHAGRSEDAVHALQQITKINGLTMSVSLEDVADDHPAQPAPTINHYTGEESGIEPHARTRLAVSTALTPGDGSPSSRSSSTYSSTALDDPSLASNGIVYSYDTPREEHPPPLYPEDEGGAPSSPRPSLKRNISTSRGKSTWPTFFLPRVVAKPLETWLDKASELMAPEWRRTTILMWCSWMLMSLAFTMFNVYFPKMVENRMGRTNIVEAADSNPDPEGVMKSAMWNVVVFTLGGCPGAIVGAFMIETRLGRRKSLALSTAATGALCLLFTVVEANWALIVTSMGISFASTAMWAVLYGMTPELFITEVRGTACGNASALNRVGGMIAPIVGGILLGINNSVPVYVSAVTFFLAAICALALPFESAADVTGSTSGGGSGDYSLLH